MPSRTSFDEQQEIQQIIGAMPSRIWYRGILIVLAVIACLLVIGHFVRYPDVIEVPVILVAENPSVEMVSEVDAVLETILFSDGANVKKNETVAVFSSSVNPEDISHLELFLQRLGSLAEPAEMASAAFPSGLQLGHLQGESGHLEMLLKQLSDQYFSGYVGQQVAALKADQILVEKLNASLQQQLEKLEEEVGLAAKNYRDYQELFKEGAASEVEKDAAQTAWLGLQRLLESKRSEIIQNKLDDSQINNRIMMLQQTDQTSWQENLRQIRRQCSVLSGQIEAWKKLYQITAPMDGKLVFAERRSIGQYFTRGSAVFSIIPEGKAGQMVAIGKLSGAGTGKVKKDLKTFIRLTAFPYKEFGELVGQVGKIAEAPVVDNGLTAYELTIELPDSLKTNFGRTLQYRQNMPGLARVLTEDKSVLGRLIEVFYLKGKRI